MYQFKALPKFERQFKKFHSKEQRVIRGELKKLQTNTAIGERKKGALSDVWVHKFKIQHQLYLLAYEPVAQGKIIYLYAIATHENFYSSLHKYLR